MRFTAKHWNQIETLFEIDTYRSWDGKLMLGVWTPTDEGISVPLLPEQLDELIALLQDTRKGKLHSKEGTDGGTLCTD